MIELNRHTGAPRIELGREPLTVAVIVRLALSALVLIGFGIAAGRTLAAATPVAAEVGLLRTIGDEGGGGASEALGRTASGLGNFWFVSAVALGVAAVHRTWTHRWDTAWLIVLTLFGSLGVTGTIKLGVGRERPDDALVGALSTAFPSGHAVRSIAVYGLAVWVLLRLPTPPAAMRVLGTVLLAGVIVAIGFSRMFLGAHWPSDVLLGYVFGTLWLLTVLLSVRPRVVAAPSH